MAMGNVYSVTVNVSGVTIAKTLIQLVAGATTAIEILRASVTNTSVEASDTGEIILVRKTAAATVTSATPLLLVGIQAAADAIGGAALTGTNASGEGTDGDILIREGFNVLSGMLYLPIPEERIIIPGAGIIGLKSNITLASVDLAAIIIFKELG